MVIERIFIQLNGLVTETIEAFRQQQDQPIKSIYGAFMERNSFNKLFKCVKFMDILCQFKDFRENRLRNIDVQKLLCIAKQVRFFYESPCI